MRKALIVVAVTTTTVATGLAAFAIARDSDHPSQVSITKAHPLTSSTADYEGNVKSGKSACEQRRKVILYHDSHPRFRIGSDKTDADGRWAMHNRPAPPVGEKIYAVATFKGIAHTDRDCAADESPDVSYPKG